MVAQKWMAASAVVACLVLGVAGCETVPPDMDTRVSGQPGLQSRDLREMTDRMAPDLLAIPEITQNPTRVVIAMKSIQNKTESEPGRNFDIYVARLKTLLNNSKCRDRLAFVEQKADLDRIRGEELGGGNPDPYEQGSRTGVAPVDPRVLPQFALWGTFYSKYDGKTTYYLCTFRLTNFATGVQVWENSYEVSTLNVTN
jgi:hypothetical protein